MKRTFLIAVGALVASSGLSARTFEISAWRGETVASLLPDSCETAEPPKDLGVRFGGLAAVDYAPQPGVLRRERCYDRVVWGSESAGPRVVEVSVPADAKAGTYDCGMMRVRVVDRVLPPPSKWKYYLDLWQHPWAVARYHRVRPFSKEHYDRMRPVYELLATAGQKTITVTLLDQPWDHQCRDAYHSMLTDDFRLFDEYVAFCRSCGLGPDISCYSLCPWTLGKTIDEAVFERRWGEQIDRFVAHLKEKGWYAQTIMAMDERTPEDVAKVAAFVRRHAPGMRISMAGNRKPSDFRGIDIHVYAQELVSDFLSPEFFTEAADRRAKGFVTTHYVCCGPACPNTFMSSGRGEAFWVGACPAFLGLDGFLRWAWNSWPEDPTKDATYGDWRAGDTFLCYPNGEPSWRFLELRNGIIAAEKVRILRESGVLSDGHAAVAALYDVRKANDGACDFMKVREATIRLVNGK